MRYIRYWTVIDHYMNMIYAVYILYIHIYIGYKGETHLKSNIFHTPNFAEPSGKSSPVVLLGVVPK